MPFTDKSTSVTVAAACSREQSQHSLCRACLEACPTQAVALAGHRISIDEARCIDCGACGFACPSAAIETQTVPRTIAGSVLAARNDAFAPHPHELLQWVCHESVRSVAIARDAPSQRWREAVAAANLVLAGVGREMLEIDDRSAEDMPQQVASRRDFLRMRRADESSGTRRVALTPRPLSALFPETSFFAVGIDQKSCTLCGACTRACKTGAIRFETKDDRKALILDDGLCSGCALCADTCLERALAVEARMEPREIRSHAVHVAVCNACNSPFHAWEGTGGRCHICEKRAALYGESVLGA